MPFTDNDVREILSLAIDLTQGNAPAGAHERFERMVGRSIGTVRAVSQYEHIVLFAFDPATNVIVGKRLVSGAAPDVDTVFDQFSSSEQFRGKAIELWGARWDWKGPESYSCMKSLNRPTGAPVGDLAYEALTALVADEAGFEPNEYQKAAIQAYAEGDYAHLADIKGRAAFYKAVEDVGDTLFRFAIIELDSREGLDGQDDAVRRMERASEEMSDLAGAVSNVVSVKPTA